MKNLFFLILIFLYSNSSILAEENEIDTVKIGIFISNIFDLKFPDNQLNIDFYIWYNFTNDSLNPSKSFEVINAKQYNVSGEFEEDYGEINYQTFKCNSVILKEWDVTDFPFDRHSVNIFIEDIDLDVTKMIFIPDLNGSIMSREINPDGWEIYDFKVEVVKHTYQTTYGDPTLSSDDYSTYSRLVVSFNLKRTGSGLFIKLFTGLFIAVLISIISLAINPMDLDPRFGLSIGAIFAAIASQYVVNSTLPETTTITFVDILHKIAFIYIFICIFVSTVSLKFYETDRKRISYLIDRYSLVILSLSYFILVLVLVLQRI